MKNVLLILAGACLCGCFSPEPRVIDSPDPALKIPAIKSAVNQHDIRAVGQLVKDLDNDDAAVRFYAIEALHRLTGQTYGFRYYDDEIQRKPALDLWKAWLAEQRSAGAADVPVSGPAASPSTKPL